MRYLYTISLLLIFASQSWATDWYFDIESIGGQCNNANTGNVITAPMCSPYNKWINGWNAPAAGDTIYLRGGTYPYRQFWFKAGTLLNGTIANPITVRPYPGETVIFNGQLGYNFETLSSTDKLVNLEVGYRDGIHFIGPFIAHHYNHLTEGGTPAGYNKNWKFEKFTISNGASGIYLRRFDGITVKDISCQDMLMSGDHNICVGIDGTADYPSDNVSISNITVDNINDGRGGTDGDADGVWTDEYCLNATFDNIRVSRSSEDGVDTKCQNVVMRNITTYNNNATGVKLWGGNQARTCTYTVSNILSYGNKETGIKCTGNGDTVNAAIDSFTAYANGEDNIKNVQGFDGSNACVATWRNGLVGNGRQRGMYFAAPGADDFLNTNHLVNVNMVHTGSEEAIAVGCGDVLPGKYTLAQYTNGTYDTDMTAGVDCASYHGDLSGSATGETSIDPLIVAPPEVFAWAAITTTAVSSDTLTLRITALYPWPTTIAVGQYITIADDGIRREVTAVDSTAKTITFTPAVSSTVYGNLGANADVRITGWGADNTPVTVNATLQSTSPVKDAGLYVAGVHCALADDNGGSALTGCVHWRGTAPDLGYMEYAPAGAQAFRPRARITTAP